MGYFESLESTGVFDRSERPRFDESIAFSYENLEKIHLKQTEVAELKEKLQHDILSLIKEFENKTGNGVMEIQLLKRQNNLCETTFIRILVGIW